MASELLYKRGGASLQGKSPSQRRSRSDSKNGIANTQHSFGESEKLVSEKCMGQSVGCKLTFRQNYDAAGCYTRCLEHLQSSSCRTSRSSNCLRASEQVNSQNINNSQYSNKYFHLPAFPCHPTRECNTELAVDDSSSRTNQALDFQVVLPGSVSASQNTLRLMECFHSKSEFEGCKENGGMIAAQTKSRLDVSGSCRTDQAVSESCTGARTHVELKSSNFVLVEMLRWL